MNLSRRRHLLGLRDFSRDELEEILGATKGMKDILERPIKKVPTLRGITVVNLFFEPSTRTRLSFELAEKRLSADTLNFTPGGSSVSKGETFHDTARNLMAMKPDMIVVRHSSSGAAEILTRVVDAAIINAGDGCHEHPTQGLLDLFTIREHFGTLEGLTVGIYGDIENSRVARSDIFGLTTMGARVLVGGPRTLVPRQVEALGAEVELDLDRMLARVDALVLLRIQKERAQNGSIPSLREYAVHYGLTGARLAAAAKRVMVMHPGPINRGLEIAPEVADGDHSLILDQVTNGVAVRMAVLYLLAGGLSNE
jgi:aspartate carbamoyltransferase catalytic subunit